MKLLADGGHGIFHAQIYAVWYNWVMGEAKKKTISTPKDIRRKGSIQRDTNETKISVSVELGSSAASKISSGVSFLDHMLEQIAKHGQMKLDISCKGDNHIDDHHSVEDIGISFGQALFEALGDKKGIVRFASCYAPLDEALSRTVIDLSGRPSLSLHSQWTSAKIKDFDVQLVREFFQGVANGAAMTLHIDCLRGINCHHQVESVFKSFALALKQATSITELNSIPSTKGVL